MSQSEPSAPDPAHDPRTPDILDIVAKETQLDRSLLSLDASIEALGIPSLDMVQIIFEIESRYDAEIPVVSDQAGAEFRTIGDLVAHALRAIDTAEAERTAAGGKTPAQARPTSGLAG
jgi:acyl carrier protein